MRRFIILIVIGLLSCQKHEQSNCASEIGTIKKGSTLGLLLCADDLFIVRNDNKIIQPVITHDLLNGLSEGDVIRFGYKQIFLGMRSCGENIETAELLCVDASK